MILPRRSLVLVALVVALAPTPATQVQTPNPQTKPNVSTFSPCEVTKNPRRYDNKIVSVRASVQINSEYSILEDRHCSDAVWLVLGDGSSLHGLAMTVGQEPSRAQNHRKFSRVPITLKRDASYKELERFLQINAKGESCTDNASALNPPDCRTYRITATFTGRVDGVPPPVKSGPGATERQGFGQMGLFKAQIVVQSVSDVSAEEIKPE